MSIRLVIQVLVALFVVSFGGVLLRYGGVFWRMQDVVQQDEDVVAVNESLYGVVLSMKDERFLHTKNVLTSLGMEVVQKLPPSFLSKEVDRGLETFVGSRNYHTATFLKVWSNRMAFIDALEEFVQDTRTTPNTWRFFFEDDIGLHPNVTAERGRLLVAKGLKLADKGGFIYLGLCGPTCSEPPTQLDTDVEAARCAGTCAHAFGFQRRRAGEFLTEMSALTLTGGDAVILGFYFDRYMYEYGNQVQQVWLVGSNLKSPIPSLSDHFGLLYQDRAMYPSTIGK